jgi:hypothetical protein
VDAVEKRSDQIFAAWKAFHEANPRVWELFLRYSSELIYAGVPRYSADAILHRIRWHFAIETRHGEIKINNNFAAYYARLFAERNPQLAAFFETRRLNSEDRPAIEPDRQEFIDAADGSRHVGVAEAAAHG